MAAIPPPQVAQHTQLCSACLAARRLPVTWPTPLLSASRHGYGPRRPPNAARPTRAERPQPALIHPRPRPVCDIRPRPYFRHWPDAADGIQPPRHVVSGRGRVSRHRHHDQAQPRPWTARRMDAVDIRTKPSLVLVQPGDRAHHNLNHPELNPRRLHDLRYLTRPRLLAARALEDARHCR